MCYKVPNASGPTNTLTSASRGGSARLTAEEESDCISMKKTNYSKSTLLYFLKVCLYGCYTKCQFYQISLSTNST